MAKKIETTAENCLKHFQTAFIAGERSDKNIHTALIVGLAHAGRNDMDIIAVSKMMEYCILKAPESHRTNAIRDWLENVAFLSVDKETGKVTTKKKQEYNVEWLDGCKAKPWYSHARDMQEFSVPKFNANQIAAILYKRKYAEGEAPDFQAIAKEIEAAYAKLEKKPTAQILKWQRKADEHKAENEPEVEQAVNG